MPDKWIKIKDRPLDTGLFAGGKIEILETGVHPTRNRKIQPVIKITDSLGGTTKVHYNDCKDIVGFYRKYNPSNSALSAILEIEQMNMCRQELKLMSRDK